VNPRLEFYIRIEMKRRKEINIRMMEGMLEMDRKVNT